MHKKLKNNRVGERNSVDSKQMENNYRVIKWMTCPLCINASELTVLEDGLCQEGYEEAMSISLHRCVPVFYCPEHLL